MSKRVLITGGNKGIGLAVSQAMLELDYEIIVLGRDFSDFPLGGLPNVTEIQADLSDLSNIASIVNEVGDIDILINNAGYMQPKYSYDSYPEEERTKLMNVNLYAPVELMNAFSKSMIKRKSGRIVNTASIAGQIGHPDVWYGISRAGIINATKIYAKLLGEHGITVNCVSPSATQTDMQNDNTEQRKKEFLKTVVAKRFAHPEEIAKTIVWLACEAPIYINGTCIDINSCAYFR